MSHLTGRLPSQSLLQQRYLIVGQAGRGGMGAVYQALDTRIGKRRVAIKEMSQNLLNAAQLAAASARFHQEAEMLGALSHPNLPRIYDAFSEDGRSYLVMDFIEGKTLYEMLQENGNKPLPVPQVIQYAHQLCSVLAYLHEQQPPIIFRDLKPTNIMVNQQGHVFLIDFGIARFFKEGQLQDTVFLGSPGYAAPEQHGTAQTNARTDLYGLGATLHHCLTGRDPYYSHNHFSFSPIHTYNPEVPSALEQLIEQLVSYNASQRPDHAREVQKRLQMIEQQLATVPPRAKVYPETALPPTDSSTIPMSSFTHAAPPPPPMPTIAVHATKPSNSNLATPTSNPQPQNTESLFLLWSWSFLLLSGLCFFITFSASIYAISTIVSNQQPGDASLVEACLLLLLFLMTLTTLGGVRSLAARIILLVTSLGTAIAGLLLIGSQPHALPLFEPVIKQPALLSASLILCVIPSFGWMLRPFTSVERLLLLILFGLAALCAALQPLYEISAVSKHLLILATLLLLAQGTLLATRMERVHFVVSSV